MRTYKIANNIAGWVVFAVAAYTYLMTIEPTASFWDCGEFIVSAVKLEVGHPPGNPIFMMTANLFTQLTSNPSMKAMMVNSMSALFSALTILFLFWTITHLARKLVVKTEDASMTLTNIITVIGAGAVGALAYTWSDTFWFSAVESEVYAFSSMMTALVFWLILKWEDVADEPHSNRWLILIAYLMGISIAVHLLNLLCIPAIVLVFYFKKYKNPTTKGTIFALLLSFVLVAIMLFGIIQGVVEIAGYSELLFVNVFGLPYNSGVVVYVVAVFGVLVWGIWESMRDNINTGRMKTAFITAVVLLGIPFFGSNPVIGILLSIVFAAAVFWYKKINPAVLNTIMTGLLVITIGYSSYALIMIRSAANTPMDQNSPEDIFTLRTYLNREQYGETPLVYGNSYSSLVTDVKDGEPVWTRIPKKDASEKDRYFVSYYKPKYIYPDELKMIFPRMYDSSKAQAYQDWVSVNGKRVYLRNYDRTVVMPSFAENIRYFFKYQVNYMYWRYFMWNFSGRQNDLQGQGEISKGNWITGFKFIDKYLAGPQDNMPDSIAKNKGHNKYYMLPLILGILGILFQINSGKKGNQGFWIVFLLFFMTGLAIVLYLNQPPMQPRERDYAYAGSFYAFSIWIGLGVAEIIRLIGKAKIPALPAAVAGSIICLLVPIQMVSQTWDDHDRSDRFICRDFGYNYLTTCAPNAIIYTMGDNDTFPLWYAQEVEGYRTDVRVCNLSYLQTDWYINQMKLQAYESTPLPISWTYADYIQGKNEQAAIIEQTSEPWEVTRAFNRVRSDLKETKMARLQDGRVVDIGSNIPTKTLYIPVDSAAAVNSGLLSPGVKPADRLTFNFDPLLDKDGHTVRGEKKSLTKTNMMIYDMANNDRDWKRPIYYSLTVGSGEYGLLMPYLRQEGIAFRFVPFDALNQSDVNTDALYDNLMTKYRWGNLEQPGLYIDETSANQANNFRSFFGMLGRKLIEEGKKDSVEAVLDRGLKVIPEYNVPFDTRIFEYADGYYQIGKIDKAKAIYKSMLDDALTNLEWYSHLSRAEYATVVRDARSYIGQLQACLLFYKEADSSVTDKYLGDFQRYCNQYDGFFGNQQRRGGENK
jgi:hypothetical protein